MTAGGTAVWWAKEELECVRGRRGKPDIPTPKRDIIGGCPTYETY
jgi:hypothetical protein